MGIMHNGKPGIRPWMYSVYAETILTSVAVALNEKSTLMVMTAWCNLLGYVLKRMLGTAIKNLSYPTECMTSVIHTAIDEASIILKSNSGRNPCVESTRSSVFAGTTATPSQRQISRDSACSKKERNPSFGEAPQQAKEQAGAGAPPVANRVIPAIQLPL